MSVWELTRSMWWAALGMLPDALLAVGLLPDLQLLHRLGGSVGGWGGRFASGVVIASGVICLTAPVYAAVWLGRYWSGKRPLRFVTLRIIPLILAGCLITLVLLLESASATTLGHRNTTTVTIWLMSLLLPLFSLAGVVIWIGHGRQAGRWLRLHSLLVSLAGLLICIYLGYWGLIGIQTWEQ